MTMRFYMTPGSCSTGIHLLLEELELVFEVYLVDLMKGENRTPEYLALNPKGTVPTLVTDSGSILTDFMSIAWWLGRAFARSRLMPLELTSELKALEVMNYAVNVVHGQGYTRVFTPQIYLPAGGDAEPIIQQGKQMVSTGLAWLDRCLGQSEYLLEQFSIVDGALFYVEFWADRIGLPLPQACAAHYQRMLQRPAVRRVLLEEGYSSLYR